MAALPASDKPQRLLLDIVEDGAGQPVRVPILVRKGRRPGFTDAMAPEPAKALYLRVCALLRDRGVVVAEGEFRATMRVEIVNEGPVTLLLDSKRVF